MFPRLFLPSALLLFAAVATAQPQRARGNPLETVAKFLDLSQTQVDQLKDLLEERKAKTAGIRESLQKERADLREMMNSTSPNPTLVGEAYIRIHRLRQQLADAQQAFMDSFEKILSEEQKARLKAIQRARRIAPFLRAFRALWIN
ncbi:MAG: Spy/CpxP family protein refolding chaperone [Acidobacteria bacterium]|nr:Spy/CpxP family protein refolding chaperone [Acidobacteriota bacterium]